MDFKAEHTSKIDASVIWQTQVGTRENCGVAHVESKQIFELFSCFSGSRVAVGAGSERVRISGPRLVS